MVLPYELWRVRRGHEVGTCFVVFPLADHVERYPARVGQSIIN